MWHVVVVTWTLDMIRVNYIYKGHHLFELITIRPKWVFILEINLVQI